MSAGTMELEGKTLLFPPAWSDHFGAASRPSPTEGGEGEEETSFMRLPIFVPWIE